MIEAFLYRHFLSPLVMNLAIQWGSAKHLDEDKRKRFIFNYVRKNFSVFPVLFQTFIYFFCGLFLFSSWCCYLKSFSRLKSDKAIRLLEIWRFSFLPGCSEFIQLFENLIAVSMFAVIVDSYDQE